MSRIDEDLFEVQCKEIGGEYVRNDLERFRRGDITFHNCRIGSNEEGQRRTLQWKQNPEDAPDKGSVSITGRAGGHVNNPKRTEVETPSRFDEEAAAELGVKARKKLRIIGEDGERVYMHGTGD